MAIATYLTRLTDLKNTLANTLTKKGVAVGDNPTLSTLVPQVNDLGSDKPFDKVLYSFGVLSDIHLKDSQYGVDDCNSISDYQRALTFYNNYGCNFIAIAGDIVASNYGGTPYVNTNAQAEWLSELRKFVELNTEYFPNKKVYTCTGNHDANPNGHYENPNDGLIGLSQQITDGGTTQDGVTWWQSIVGNPINHTVAVGDNDIFIFFSMRYWNYSDMVTDGTTNGFYSQSDIEWLKQELEKYNDKRVFLFFHLPIQLYNEVGYLDPSSNGLVVGYTPNTVMAQILLNYKNVIWFNGHTHYKLEYEGYTFHYTDEYEDGDITFTHPNIYQTDESMTMIHCSSCSHPREVTTKERNNDHTWNGKWKYSNLKTGSQGYVVDVYEKRIVIKGVDFASQDKPFIEKVKYIVS